MTPAEPGEISAAMPPMTPPVTPPVTPLVTPPVTPPTGRDPRVDVFRGIALAMIFIDHVPDNLYTGYTLWTLGWSDAAEGFVLMSGISAGLAYGLYFRRPMRFWTGLGRVWRRVWTIYLVHILVTVCGMAATAAVASWYANPDLLQMNQIGYLLDDPVSFLRGIPILTQQLDYGDILPMYLALIFAAPIVLILAWRRPWLLLAGSVALWLATQIWRLNLPSATREFGWYFNPFAWQLIFVIGVATGVALKDGRRLVPVSRWLQGLSALVLLGAAAGLLWPAFAKLFHHALWQAQRAGWPPYLIGVEKTFLPLPRVLHAVALAYFLSSWPWVRQFCGAVGMKPFALLGRQALPVFAFGSIMVFAIQTIREQIGFTLWQDTWMLATGLCAMLALAAARQYWPKD